MSRAAAVVGLSCVIAVVAAEPAWAGNGWGSVQCDQNPHPGCELGAGQGRQDSDPGPRNHLGGANHVRSEGSAGSGTGDTLIGGDPTMAHCAYQRSAYQPPPGAATPAAGMAPPGTGVTQAGPASFQTSTESVTVKPVAAGSGAGAWYDYRCEGNGSRDALYRPPVWIADKQPGPAPSPAELAAQARSQLRLPSATIMANPAGEQLVGLPTWLWLDRGSWTEVSATASVPGVSVTAAARPTAVSWSMGDGTVVSCSGPGTAFPTGGDPRRASPDCGHTYSWPSADQPNQAYPLSATVHWAVTWSGSGQAGTFPGMTTTAIAALRVAESQALTSGGG